MTELTFFAIQLAISLVISLTVLGVLTPHLRNVLKETCGTESSSAFWIKFTQLMMIITPLVIVIFFSHGSGSAAYYDFEHHSSVTLIRETILETLFGLLIGLMIVGRTIYKAIDSAQAIQRQFIPLSKE